MFKDESPQDLIDRMQELFSVEILEDDLELGVEHLPGKSSGHPQM